MWLILAPVSFANPWVRVDDPDHPGAVARSETGALLDAPPAPGIRWRWASIPETDQSASDSTADWFVGLEAIPVTQAHRWHEEGISGAGVRVAVFDIGWSGATVDLSLFETATRHDCFERRTCEIPFDPLRLAPVGTVGAHGYACAEVIQAMAPGAELHLVRVNSFTMFENAVDWAIREDIDIISMSMSFYRDSFYDGTGPHHRLLHRLEAADILLVTSAGNLARQHWQGPYLDGDGDGRADGPNGNGIWVDLPRNSSVQVAWNQFGQCGQTDLDVVVLDASGLGVGRGDDRQSPTADHCEPYEFVDVFVDKPGLFRVEIHHQAGSTAGLELSVLTRGAGTIVDNVVHGSIADPAAHPLAVAVGAISVDNYLTGPIEPFSSWGPTRGGAPKPDISGPSRLTTTTFGPGNFSGTSAAAPVVAGLVALIRESEPELTNRQAFERLQAWSWLERGPRGRLDPAFGAGRARLAAPTRAAGCQIQPTGASWLLGPLLFFYLAHSLARKRKSHDSPLRICQTEGLR